MLLRAYAVVLHHSYFNVPCPPTHLGSAGPPKQRQGWCWCAPAAPAHLSLPAGYYCVPILSCLTINDHVDEKGGETLLLLLLLQQRLLSTSNSDRSAGVCGSFCLSLYIPLFVVWCPKSPLLLLPSPHRTHLVVDKAVRLSVLRLH